jgi:hypothetical protein
MTNENLSPQGAEAPAQPASPATPEAVVAEAPVGTEPQGGTDAPAKPKNQGVQKRLDELTRNWRQAERDRDHWREQATRNQSQPQQQPQAAQGEPSPDQYEDITKFHKAHAAWAVREELRRVKEDEANQRKEEARREKDKKFGERAAKARAKYEDFDELVFSDSTAITDDMADYIRESEEGPEVAYWLAQNPQEALRIAQMNGRDADRALARIEARLSTPAPTPAAPKPVTNAPPPPPRVGTASNAGTPVLRDDMPTAEWVRLRNKQAMAKRR